MNKLCIIVGPSGAGKTTLAHALCRHMDFLPAFEQHGDRPFQQLFKQDARYALANQIDYLMLRAEQEVELRRGSNPALMDGGLDLDFYGFTRLFHLRGWLSREEFDLCRRFHSLTRSLLPPPDLIIAVSAATQTIRERLAARDRINIASGDDAELLDLFTNEWLETVPRERILRLDLTNESMDYPFSVPLVLERINA